MDISSLCTPAYIYIIIAFIYLLITMFKSFNIIGTLIQLLVIFVWAWFLNFLCRNGYGILAWVILILPFFGLL
jgi:hypothetical protein